MKVAFRVDSSREIGSGHLVREITLAEALRTAGAEVIFVCRGHEGALLNLLSQRQFAMLVLPLVMSATQHDGSYAHWLGASQQQDAHETAQALAANGFGECDWMVVDHYALDQTWETILRQVCTRIMVIDDLADRPHHCDLLLDQNLVAGFRERYRDLVSGDTEQLLGPQYALLHPQYAELRQATLRPAQARRILAYFGASDLPNLTCLTIRAFAEIPAENLTLSVVLGDSNPHRSEVLKLAGHDSRIQVHTALPSLAELMAQSDICVGAGGATTWERLCLKLPSLVYALADNQVAVSQHLAELGLIRFMGLAQHASVVPLREGLRAVLSNAWRPQWEGIEVDGLGASRVASHLLQNRP